MLALAFVSGENMLTVAIPLWYYKLGIMDLHTLTLR